MAPKDNKSEVVNLRLTPQNKKNVEEKAAQQNMKVSGYLNKLILDYERMDAEYSGLVSKNTLLSESLSRTNSSLGVIKHEAEALGSIEFLRLYDSVKGKLVNEVEIKSKYDFVKVWATSTKVDFEKDETPTIHSEITVKEQQRERTFADNIVLWLSTLDRQSIFMGAVWFVAFVLLVLIVKKVLSKR